MPLLRCWNFDDNGTRKTRPNGVEKLCHPNCGFIHPSDPDWDRAPSAPSRGGAPPTSGRGRGKSSFGASASGANASPLGPERGSSSAAWEDYMTTGFGSRPSATSSTRGASSHQSGWGTSGPSGWGDASAGGSGWGSGVNNDASASDGWSNGPSAWGEQASSSQWATQTEGWGTSGWGTAGTDREPGWGEDPIPNYTSETPSAATAVKVPGPAGPDTPMGGTRTDGIADIVTTTTSSSRAMPSTSSPSEPDVTHSEQNGDNTAPATVDFSRSEFKASPPVARLRQSSANKSIKVRPTRGEHDEYIGTKSSGASKMSDLTLYIAMALKKRELDAELSQLSTLRKSHQVATTRAAKDLLRHKVHRLTDARDAVEAEHNDCARDVIQLDSLYFPFAHYTLTTLGHKDGQLKLVKDWVSGAESYLGHIQTKSSSILSIKSNGAAQVYKLDQLKQRSDSLAETGLPCQDLQDYNTFLDHQIQEKKDLILAAIIKSQDITYINHLSTCFSNLQKQGEMWNQTLQIQSKEFAQALLQNNQLREDERSRSVIRDKKKDSIQQADIIQRRQQLQALQEEMSQLQHILTSIKQQQQSLIMINSHEYTPYFQEYIKRYIQTNTIPHIKVVLENSVTQFAAIELETVKKVWKALQPILQMSILLQDLDMYKTEEEMDIREIEESLIT